MTTLNARYSSGEPKQGQIKEHCTPNFPIENLADFSSLSEKLRKKTELLQVSGKISYIFYML